MENYIIAIKGYNKKNSKLNERQKLKNLPEK